MKSHSSLTEVVGSVLDGFQELRFALVFGSAATGRLREDSDLDVAVYLDSEGRLEIEEEREFLEEADLQIALEEAAGLNVELLLLNRAPATVCASAVLTGKVVLLRDPALFRRYTLAVSDVAEGFLETERDFRAIRERSQSISEFDVARLERILDFVDEELQDRSQFSEVDLFSYQTERGIRRNLDRWVETLINAAIDIGKIVLASHHRPVPQTYGQILAELETERPFSELAGRLRKLAPLRNVIAHEYLDLRFGRVKAFVEGSAGDIEELAALTRRWLAAERE